MFKWLKVWWQARKLKKSLKEFREKVASTLFREKVRKEAQQLEVADYILTTVLHENRWVAGVEIMQQEFRRLLEATLPDVVFSQDSQERTRSGAKAGTIYFLVTDEIAFVTAYEVQRVGQESGPLKSPLELLRGLPAFYAADHSQIHITVYRKSPEPK